MDQPLRRPPAARAAIAMAKAKTYQDAADAPSTVRAYAADLNNFEAWCTANGFLAMPAKPEIVGAYLAAAGEGYAMQTLRRRVAAIARASGVAGHPLDTKHHLRPSKMSFAQPQNQSAKKDLGRQDASRTSALS